MDSPIQTHYLSHGAAAGVLGNPVGDEEDVTGADGLPGRRRHFRGVLYGAEHAISLRIPPERAYPTCHRPDEDGTPVESTIAWSERTGAHVVHGEIRELWLKLGGQGGELGYPVSNEMPTPDGCGRRSRFQFGEIWWSPDTGAVVRPLELDHG